MSQSYFLVLYTLRTTLGKRRSALVLPAEDTELPHLPSFGFSTLVPTSEKHSSYNSRNFNCGYIRMGSIVPKF